MGDLTASQLAVLRATDGRSRTRDDLAERARIFHGWTGRIDGLNQTLGSLTRRGLLERGKYAGRIHWRITDKGAVTARSYR